MDWFDGFLLGFVLGFILSAVVSIWSQAKAS